MPKRGTFDWDEVDTAAQ